jgi:hypothetical protein
MKLGKTSWVCSKSGCYGYREALSLLSKNFDPKAKPVPPTKPAAIPPHILGILESTPGGRHGARSYEHERTKSKPNLNRTRIFKSDIVALLRASQGDEEVAAELRLWAPESIPTKRPKKKKVKTAQPTRRWHE